MFFAPCSMEKGQVIEAMRHAGDLRELMLVPITNDLLTERERVVALREKRVEMLLALVEATQGKLEERLRDLDRVPVFDLDSLEADRFERDRYMQDPACSYLLLATGALEPKAAARRDMSQALLGAVKRRPAAELELDIEELQVDDEAVVRAVN